MKRVIIILIIAIFAVTWISYVYFTYKADYNKIKTENAIYEYYLNREVYGGELSTIINKAMDSNEKNEVLKDSKGKYIPNDENSIKIDIKILGITDEYNFDMETISVGGISSFMDFNSTQKFICKKLEYHKKTGQVSYLYFENI